MRDLTTLRKRVEELRLAAAAERSSSSREWWLHATEEEKRQKFIDVLGGREGMVGQAFGAEDPRASREHLSMLTLSQLCEVYRETMPVYAAKTIDPEELVWFRSLPVEQKILIPRSGNARSHYQRYLQGRDRTG